MERDRIPQRRDNEIIPHAKKSYHSSSVKQTKRTKKRKGKRKKKSNVPLDKHAIKKLDRKESKKKSFNCNFEGLGNENIEIDTDQSCTPYPRAQKDCDKAFGYMSPVKTQGVKCSEADEPICVIKTQYRYSSEEEVDIECNPAGCEDEVLVGCVDKNYGIIPRDEKYWQTFDSVESLEPNLPRILKQNSINGYNHCFLKCGGDEKNDLQPLIFPPIIKQRRTPGGSAININILLEDAVSRSHFYRSLPRAVGTLRRLAQNKESRMNVLDFELVQSYASYTLSNIRALFCGNKKQKFNSQRESGIYNMMSSFQRNGYQTLVQEDLCFFDFWGSILSENYNNKLKPFSKKFKEFYKQYLNVTNTFLDNKGLTSLACEHLRVHGYSNPFQISENKCLNGKVISHYMLKYVERFLRGAESSGDNAPAIVYTHLNTGHEKTGERIRFDDVPLSEHITAVSKLRNTITIILSDHGSKTTEYSISNFHGRLEVFSPMMFMIIPDSVAQRLGNTVMENLVNNQKRLVALVDLHGMLNAIMTKGTPSVNDYHLSGLLAPIPLNRTCGDIKDLSTDAYCRCKGWNRFVDTKHQTTRWLSEVALGEINNRITKQFKETHETKATSLGYGACARFRGESIEQARQSFAGNDVITTLLLIVVPIYGSQSTERFEVTLKHSSVGEPHVRVMDIIRVSVYGKYESCADKGVDLKLCACSKGVTAQSIRPRMNFKALLLQTHFGLKTSTRTFKFSRCLIFAERKLKTKTIHKIQTRLKAFEIANTCGEKYLKVKFGGKFKKSKISKPLPFYLTISPRSVLFLYAVDNAWRYGKFHPLVSLSEDSPEDD